MQLWILLLIPIATCVGIAFGGERNARAVALGGSLATLAWAVVLAMQFPHWQADQWTYWPAPDSGAFPVLPGIGVALELGVDSVSLLLVLLNVFLMPCCVLGSWSAIQERRREFYIWLMVLSTCVMGVFVARDVISFYTFFEASLVPGFFMLAIYGGPDRREASFKFFIYTFVGSLFMLLGLAYVAWQHAEQTGDWSFAIKDLTAFAPSLSAEEQGWILLALLAGLAVKVPLFPLHTWLPLAHNQAPTAGSVNFAAVILKLGLYGLYVFILPMVPEAVVTWAPTIAVLAVIGIVYAALICWVQTDVKKLIAYSSVSHMGFAVLGLIALNPIGLQGSVFYMLSHGFATGGLFLCIGMMYERYHTKDLREVGGLAFKMPVWSFFFIVLVFASVGLPGLNGFVSEFLCLIGTFIAVPGAQSGYGGVLGPWFAAVAATGMVLGAMYLLYMTGKLCFGPLREPADHHDHEELPADLNLREIAAVAPIALVCLVFGLVPWPILHAVEPVAEEVLKPYPALVEAHVQRMEQMEAAESVAFSPASTTGVTPADTVPAERSR
ncbi:MAG: NADH-quinone oxidoreductase subunit M [Phycisphaeraceae bacterium]|nr:NADH-quinone oxidoreductase subunit M [Phycisphaeraceae bacterium]MDG1361515.1 NADH-quinone oxidoreductase subunit M [Phycisphaerales bacterium]MCP4012527.1 NADH-quinone oxidoreductase subunit M [Phycisphaeraceae bacterium]MCP4067663.1 NADH-quinone oxidoreductase subunit M [Phycisphaeraceae bacterium]MCP4795272.1 NADH-quinone oxidoreductase subunit M [Phycisphaeraceae bacterium]